MSSASELSTRIDELEKSLKALSQEVRGDELARKRLHAIASEHAAELEAPHEFIQRMLMEVF
jgi:hypothetical protein